MEGCETWGVGYWVAALFIVVAVFSLPFAKGGLVNLTWWMTILQSLTRCSTGRSMYLQICWLNGMRPVENVSQIQLEN